MTGCALFRRGLIEQYLLVIHRLEQRVASFAANVPVHAFERQSGATVIEQRRFPLIGVMAVSAVSYPGFRKLPGVHVLMAVFADRRGGTEIDTRQFQTQVWRLVALDAVDSAVRSGEREIGF